MKNTVRILTLVVLISICWVEAALADITIDGESVHVETDAYTVRFDKGVMSYIHNKRTGETYTIPASPGIEGNTAVIGRHQWVVWARHSAVESIQTGPDSATLVFRQSSGNFFNLYLEIEPMTGDLLITGRGEADTFGVYAFRWSCDNIDINNLDVILPAQGGQVVTGSTPFDREQYSYPASWEAQLAIVQGEQGGFFVRTADETFPYQRLIWKKNSEELALSFGTINQAPWDATNTVESVVWRFNTYAGDYRVPAQIHRYWMEAAFQPWRLADMPSWVEDIGLVVMVGSSDLMGLELEMASKLAEEVDPSKTLLYLVNWREHDYGTYLPDYTPSKGLGDFVEAVRDMGYRVMLHADIIGVSTYHPLYAEFQAFQLVNTNGMLMGWRWDELDHPRRSAWISSASSKFRDVLVSQLKQVWNEYHVDAFHLDGSHVVANTANGLIEGLNAKQGNVLMHKQLAEAMPGVVFGGEHLHEVTFFRESFAQRWRLSPELTPHPISSFLFSPYTRPYGYLGMPHVHDEQSASLFQSHLDSYERWGVLPTVWSWGLQLHNRPYHPLVQEVLDTAREWQELGLRPHFESDWGADNLFQYVTENGETVIYQKTDSGHTLRIERFPDLNQDGVINILDLVMVSNYFGTADGDLNGDGETNILDLVIVAQHLR